MTKRAFKSRKHADTALPRLFLSASSVHEHADTVKPCPKCGHDVCEDVNECQGCGYDEAAACERRGSSTAVLQGLFGAAFFKEDQELARSKRAFGVTGSVSLPPPLIWVEEIDDNLGLPLPKAQARELLSLRGGGAAAVVNAPQLRIDNPAFEAALDDLIKGQLCAELEIEMECAPLRKELRQLIVYGPGHTHSIQGSQVRPQTRLRSGECSASCTREPTCAKARAILDFLRTHHHRLVLLTHCPSLSHSP